MKKILIIVIVLVCLQSCKTQKGSQGCGAGIFTHKGFSKMPR
jgi:hypothetical protein